IAPPDPVVEPELALGLLAGRRGRARVVEVTVADRDRGRAGRRWSDAGQGGAHDDRSTKDPHSRTSLAHSRLTADHLGLLVLRGSGRRRAPSCIAPFRTG